MNMKKGFTLIELLIIMVVVGLLVTIALPQYKVAMEKGRGLEALHNVQAMSEAANAFCLSNAYYSYEVAGPSDNDVPLKNYVARVAGTINNNYFNTTVYAVTPGQAWIKAIRQGLSDANSYEITFENVECELKYKYCTGNQKFCNAIGAVQPRDEGGWYF